MKRLHLIALAVVFVAIDLSQAFAQETNAPLFVFLNSGGSVSPFTNGEFLAVGQSYNMVATPEPGYEFDSWQPVNVFTFTNFVTDSAGNTIPVVSTTASPMPTYTNQPSLDFIMQPVVVISDNPGVRIITRSTGWQANFSPILLNIHATDSGVIVTWTNLSFILQATAMLLGNYTNVSGAVSPYTNSLSSKSQFFRLISN
jgi:hypothetical protein